MERFPTADKEKRKKSHKCIKLIPPTLFDSIPTERKKEKKIEMCIFYSFNIRSISLTAQKENIN